MLKKRVALSALFFAQISLPVTIIQKPSGNFNERIEKSTGKKITTPTHIILHYTTDCFHGKAYRTLSNFLHPVSAHYLIAADGTIYQLVDESKRAWHAGKSFWLKKKDLNTHSIGIEIVNPGFSKKKKNPCTKNHDIWNASTSKQVQGSTYHWYEFTPEQINNVTELCKDIIKRHDIAPNFILGHSDIAPGRKVDPGPLFPWQHLARDGVGIWPQQPQEKTTELPKLKKVQQMLQDFGYDVKPSGKLDHKTKKAIKAFQMHFRPNNIDGILDLETVELLQNLLKS